MNNPLPPAPVEVGRIQPARVAVRLPRTRPVVVYTLMAISILTYIAQQISTAVLGYDLPVELGAKYGPLILSGEIWRLFTPVFLHGSIYHILFNMYALYAIGRELERYYGHGRFLLLYAVSGFAGNVLSFLMTPAPSVGASTALFGMLAAEGVFIYRNRFLFGGGARRMLTNVIGVAAINLLLGLNPGIDNWGHLGGLIGGLLFAWIAGPLPKIEGLDPDYYLGDQHDLNRAWLATAVVGLLFTLLAAFKFLG